MAHWLFHKSEAEAHWAADSLEWSRFKVEQLDLCLFPVRGRWVYGVTILKSTGVYAVQWHWAEPQHTVIPESNPFHGSHKVLLTFKIHSSEFIRWSEVARAPKTNRGLRSGISDGQVPRTHHSVGHTKGDNRRHEPDLLLATLSAQHLIIKEVITQISRGGQKYIN